MAVEPFRVEGLAGVLKTLQELPPEIVSKAGGPVKFGLKAAMKMMAAEVKQNLQGIINEPNKGGQDESTGLLMANIKDGRARLKGKNGEAHRVYVRKKSYGDGKKASTPQVARLLEYGTERRKPMPFIRPAFDAKKGEAVRIFETEIKKRIAGIVKKLSAQNRVPK